VGRPPRSPLGQGQVDADCRPPARPGSGPRRRGLSPARAPLPVGARL